MKRQALQKKTHPVLQSVKFFQFFSFWGARSYFGLLGSIRIFRVRMHNVIFVFWFTIAIELWPLHFIYINLKSCQSYCLLYLVFVDECGVPFSWYHTHIHTHRRKFISGSERDPPLENALPTILQSSTPSPPLTHLDFCTLDQYFEFYIFLAFVDPTFDIKNPKFFLVIINCL